MDCSGPESRRRRSRDHLVIADGNPGRGIVCSGGRTGKLFKSDLVLHHGRRAGGRHRNVKRPHHLIEQLRVGIDHNARHERNRSQIGEAVQSAHAEGFGFGEAVARDAPALWLEAVLARKPRMPSDLEARLLQGSALPIDSLLHDEVRHALRRGFWDALERSRH